ncbi:PH domain-containing protein [Enterococcus sp. AZ102]|uniref:PH domain-containing protein n=1 Tax=Enterococcus sp. AZ102 TaxID=2774865 RepID=UPI003F23D334
MALDVNNKKIAKQLRYAEEHLEPGEQVLEGVYGAYETKSLGNDSVRNGVFLATDRRLFFYGKRTFGFNSESFPYSNISSIEFNKKAMGYTLSFYASGNEVKMKWINFGDVASLVNFIKFKMNEKNIKSESSLPDNSPIAQVKQMKELLDMGIITFDEFEAKKKELLNL